MKRDKPIMLMFYWVNEMAYMTLTYWEEKKMLKRWKLRHQIVEILTFWFRYFINIVIKKLRCQRTTERQQRCANLCTSLNLNKCVSKRLCLTVTFTITMMLRNQSMKYTTLYSNNHIYMNLRYQFNRDLEQINFTCD